MDLQEEEATQVISVTIGYYLEEGNKLKAEYTAAMSHDICKFLNL
jgi:hypothetical protein